MPHNEIKQVIKLAKAICQVKDKAGVPGEKRLHQFPVFGHNLNLLNQFFEGVEDLNPSIQSRINALITGPLGEPEMRKATLSNPQGKNGDDIVDFINSQASTVLEGLEKIYAGLEKDKDQIEE